MFCSLNKNILKKGLLKNFQLDPLPKSVLSLVIEILIFGKWVAVSRTRSSMEENAFSVLSVPLTRDGKEFKIDLVNMIIILWHRKSWVHSSPDGISGEYYQWSLTKIQTSFLVFIWIVRPNKITIWSYVEQCYFCIYFKHWKSIYFYTVGHSSLASLDSLTYRWINRLGVTGEHLF